ncbi:MAG: hypothetical protein ISR77_14420, partial [Pirellulaceae bacterium]|nr:hypothetical protein [Pirellulaceae bacterium]
MKDVALVLLTLAFSGRTLAEQPVTEKPNHAHFYVSAIGKDNWSGRLSVQNAEETDGPFATLTRARNAIRELKSEKRSKGPVTVMVLGGTYYLTEPFVLDSQDTGTDQEPITYTAYPGQKPILSGGRKIVGWEPYQGNILRCHLPETKEGRWSFRQLFFNGERQIRARWPNRKPNDPLYGGWAFVEATLPEGDQKAAEFRFAPDGAPRHWARPGQAEVNVFPWYCWVNDIIPVKQVDTGNRMIILGRRVQPGFMSLMP